MVLCYRRYLVLMVFMVSNVFTDLCYQGYLLICGICGNYSIIAFTIFMVLNVFRYLRYGRYLV